MAKRVSKGRGKLGHDPAALQRMVDGNALQALRSEAEGAKESLLPDARSDGSGAAGRGGVLGAADSADSERVHSPQSQAVLDLAGDEGVGFSTIFKRILMELAAAKFQDGSGLMTNYEVLCRRILEDALGGERAARDLIVNRVEGKPVHAERVSTPDTSLEEQIDKAAVAHLNAIAMPPDKQE